MATSLPILMVVVGVVLVLVVVTGELVRKLMHSANHYIFAVCRRSPDGTDCDHMEICHRPPGKERQDCAGQCSEGTCIFHEQYEMIKNLEANPITFKYF